ncbi:MAG TPA: Uma2 family endonuclease [Bryobacteraceae bacterium]|jgi:Uma2 family endonuclease|nr:Uma2 family endonuclease [Bryobacteraceae bacterium]
MPTAINETLSVPPDLEPPRKRWTREECVALEASGIWDQQHLELIEGELISKMGKKRPHTNVMVIMHAWLLRVFGEQFINQETSIDVASVDNPINEPEPDLIVLSKPSLEIRDQNPQPSEVRLLVEIADSTLRFDLTVKARLYARARIADYWVVDIPSRRIIVHRDPQEGQYRSVVAYAEQESVKPLASPDHEFPVGSAFAA